MLTVPMDVLTRHPVRKTRGQKRLFLNDTAAYCQSLGYACREETGAFGCRNLIIGDPEHAEYLITAHYDTCAGLPIANYLTPCNLGLFCLWQAVLTAAILLPCMLLASILSRITGREILGYLAGWGLLWTEIILMLIGPANPSNTNDNTSGVVALLEIAKSFPTIRRSRVCFVLFDLEEAGMLGSSAYRKAHKSQTDRQTVVNLDCVGDGDTLLFFPTRHLKKEEKRLHFLCQAEGCYGKKRIAIRRSGFSFYPSDQVNFPFGVGVCALQKRKNLLYLGRIHTKKDTVLDYTNVNLLRAALITCICRDAVQ